MKTLGYVLADFPVFSETFIGNEIRAMRSRGHKVVPLILHRRTGAAHAADRDMADAAPGLASVSNARVMRTLAIPGPRSPDAIAFALRQKRLPARSLIWNSMKIATVAREHGCEHLHAHFSGGATAHAIVAARWLGIGVSFVCHGHDVYAEAEDLPLKLATADAVVAVCDDMANDLRSREPRSRVTTITCGTDPQFLRPLADERPLPKFLFIGRLVEQKGLDDLLEAMAMCGSATLDIVGSGPLLEPYRRRAEELRLGERVRFLGDRGREWIQAEGPRYLALIAPFKIAPDGARDSGPLVVKEAMAMGLPVIATRFMGNKEMVDEATGFLTTVAHPASLAEAMLSLLGMAPLDRRAMGLRGRAKVIERFSIATQARNLSTLFEAA